MIELYAIKLHNTIYQINPQSLFQFLPIKRVNKIQLYYKKDDMLRSLISDILIRWIIYKKIGKNIKNIKVGINKNGKPFLKGNINIHFNISHSGSWIICGLDKFPIGVDIEMIKLIDFKIVKRFFSEFEYLEFIKKPDKDKLNYFYEMWTLKESYIKATSKGLRTPLNSFSISFEKNKIEIIIKGEKYFFKQYNIDKNYKMSICAMKEEFPENVQVINFFDIYNDILNWI
jgi:4'-phosphopantetheinyl transferase